MIVLMFSVKSELSDEKMARLLSEKAATLADRLADAVEDVAMQEFDWDESEIRCGLRLCAKSV